MSKRSVLPRSTLRVLQCKYLLLSKTLKKAKSVPAGNEDLPFLFCCAARDSINAFQPAAKTIQHTSKRPGKKDRGKT